MSSSASTYPINAPGIDIYIFPDGLVQLSERLEFLRCTLAHYPNEG